MSLGALASSSCLGLHASVGFLVLEHMSNKAPKLSTSPTKAVDDRSQTGVLKRDLEIDFKILEY